MKGKHSENHYSGFTLPLIGKWEKQTLERKLVTLFKNYNNDEKFFS